MLCNDEQEDVIHGIACFWRTEQAHIEEALHRAGVEVFYLDKGRSLDIGFIIRLARLIRRWKPDVLHCWLLSAVLWGRIGGMLGKRPAMVAAYRNDELLKFPGSKLLDRCLARHTQFGIANSKRVQQLFMNYLNWPASRIVQIDNGLDTDVFSPDTADADKREKLGLPRQGTIVTMVGRFARQKNWPMFVRTAKIVTDARENVCFVAVGRQDDPDSVSDEVKALVDKYALGPDKIRFLGQRRDVSEILAQSDLFVLTSDYEGMPNALLEAMSCALAIVATHISGTEEIVVDDKTGFLVKPDDAEGMAQRIIHCIDNPERACDIGRRSREHVVENFSFERMAREHREIYLAAAGIRWPERWGDESRRQLAD